ncbi:MAG: NifB/NifX family molybdenum-iron cluster-binding protein [Anaerolineae bacterium]|jgi:predicted Fe-Mo cluster-binding NifX family protein
MRIVVSSQGGTLDAPASPVFGRCPTFVFVDSETMATEAVPNPAMSQGGGAGIQAAQFVVNQGAETVLTGNLGPNAFDVLQAAGVQGYLVSEGTVGQAVAAFQAGQLQPMAGANVAAHAGMGGGRRMGRRPGAPPAAPESLDAARDAELAALRETLKGLRQQLAETMTRIENLEKEA